MSPAASSFVAALWSPFYGYERFVLQGNMTRLAPGAIGAPRFGLPNRGTTLTTPRLLRSGRVDRATLAVLAGVFVGNAALSAMDEDINGGGLTPLAAARANQALPQNAYWLDVYHNTTTQL